MPQSNKLLSDKFREYVDKTPDTEIGEMVQAMVDVAPGTARAFRLLLLILAGTDNDVRN